jgi:hypothetical protein
VHGMCLLGSIFYGSLAIHAVSSPVSPRLRQSRVHCPTVAGSLLPSLLRHRCLFLLSVPRWIRSFRFVRSAVRCFHFFIFVPSLSIPYVDSRLVSSHTVCSTSLSHRCFLVFVTVVRSVPLPLLTPVAWVFDVKFHYVRCGIWRWFLFCFLFCVQGWISSCGRSRLPRSSDPLSLRLSRQPRRLHSLRSSDPSSLTLLSSLQRLLRSPDLSFAPAYSVSFLRRFPLLPQPLFVFIILTLIPAVSPISSSSSPPAPSFIFASCVKSVAFGSAFCCPFCTSISSPLFPPLFFIFSAAAAAAFPLCARHLQLFRLRCFHSHCRCLGSVPSLIGRYLRRCTSSLPVPLPPSLYTGFLVTAAPRRALVPSLPCFVDVCRDPFVLTRDVKNWGGSYVVKWFISGGITTSEIWFYYCSL